MSKTTRPAPVSEELPAEPSVVFVVAPSFGDAFVAPEQGLHQGWTEWSASVADARRAWERHPCPFTGANVRVLRIQGRDAETENISTGALVWLPTRRLEVA